MMRAVTFDCWQTLLHNPDPGVDRAMRLEALRASVAELRGDASAARVEAAYDHACVLQFAAWHGRRAAGPCEVARWSLEALALEGDASPAQLGALAKAFAEASLSSRIDVLPGAHATLETLRREGVVTALICDTGLSPGTTVRALLDRAGLLSALGHCVFSDEVGAPKPSRRPFERALSALAVAADDAVHVGDMLRTDVAGGRAAGMRTVRLRSVFDDPAQLPEADLVADDHAKLAGLLVSALDHPGSRGRRPPLA